MNTDLADLLLHTLQLSENECQGKVIVVTGAGRGIGLQIARAFGLLGGSVVIAELSETGQQAAEEICRAGGKAVFLQTDVADLASVGSLAKKTNHAFGPVDILVNNAIRIGFAPVVEMDEALWDSIIAVNLRGTFLGCKTFLPEMLARKQGVIINMISVPMPGLSAYAASKQGILGFSQALASEVGGAGIQVVPFAPGMVDTPGIRSVADQLPAMLGTTREQFQKFSLHSAYEGWMPPEHAGVAAVYLAIRLAEEFHGQMVTGYEVLERAGMIQPAAEVPAKVPLAEISEEKTAGVRNPSAEAGAPDPDNLMRLFKTASTILDETELEFEKIPVFFRSFARSGFAGKSGASLQEWQRRLAGFQEQIKKRAFQVKAAQSLPAQLEKLIVYYQETPKEMARFTKDKKILAETTRIAQQRCMALRELVEAIKAGC